MCGIGNGMRGVELDRIIVLLNERLALIGKVIRSMFRIVTGCAELERWRRKGMESL